MKIIGKKDINYDIASKNLDNRHVDYLLNKKYKNWFHPSRSKGIYIGKFDMEGKNIAIYAIDWYIKPQYWEDKDIKDKDIDYTMSIWKFKDGESSNINFINGIVSTINLALTEFYYGESKYLNLCNKLYSTSLNIREELFNKPIINEDIKRKLKEDNWVFMPVPASTKEKTKKRFKNVCNEVSKITGCLNGYDVFNNKTDRIPKHKQGSELTDDNFEKYINISNNINLNGKNVILVDDVITKGNSFKLHAKKLIEKYPNIKKIVGIFLGRTWHVEGYNSYYKNINDDNIGKLKLINIPKSIEIDYNCAKHKLKEKVLKKEYGYFYNGIPKEYFFLWNKLDDDVKSFCNIDTSIFLKEQNVIIKFINVPKDKEIYKKGALKIFSNNYDKIKNDKRFKHINLGGKKYNMLIIVPYNKLEKNIQNKLIYLH